MKKHRFHYYEDTDTFKHISKLPHWKKSKWVRQATRELMEKDLEVIPSHAKKRLARVLK